MFRLKENKCPGSKLKGSVYQRQTLYKESLMFVHLGKIERLYNMQYVNFNLKGVINPLRTVRFFPHVL